MVEGVGLGYLFGKEVTLLNAYLHRGFEGLGYLVRSFCNFYLSCKMQANYLELSQKVSISAVFSYRGTRLSAVLLRVETHTYRRRFLNALVLTCWNLANSNYLSKTKQRERPLEVYYVMTITIDGIIIYTSAWGFQRCSFRQIGRCESLNTWNGHRTGSTFFVCMGKPKTMLPSIGVYLEYDETVKTVCH